MRSAVPSQSTGTLKRAGNRISVEGDHLKRVAGKGKAANLGGTAIQNVKEDALPLLYADGFAMTKHASIDGERMHSQLRKP